MNVIYKILKNHRETIVYAAFGFILCIIFSFQLWLDRTSVLSAESTVDESGTVEVLPGLSLGRGTYRVDLGTLVAGTTDDAAVEFYSLEHGVLLQDKISNGISVNSYTLELERPENIIYVRTISEPGIPVEIHSVTVMADRPLYTDTVVNIVLFAAVYILFGFYYFRRRMPDAKLKILLILAFGVLLSSYPLFTDYLTQGHDMNFQLYRIEGIKDGLLSGQFPVRIHPTHANGYGYATPVLYPELFLYIPAVFRLMGMSVVGSFQLFLLLINTATAFIMYYAMKDMTKSRYTAALASFIYTVSSYRVACVIQRSALGEILALCFLPLVVAGIYNLFLGDKKKWYQLVIGASAILQSHMITTLLTLMFAVTMGVIYLPKLLKEKRWLGLVKTVALILLLNLWYIVPFFDFYRLDLKLKHTSDGLSIFFNNAVIPAQLFNLFSDRYGYSHNLDGGIGGEMSMTPGLLAALCILICGIVYFIYKKEKGSYGKRLYIYGLLMLLGSTSLIPWQKLQGIGLVNSLAAMIQFPWRLLGFSSLLVIAASALLLQKAEIKWNMRQKTALMAAVLLTGMLGAVAFGTVATDQPVFLRKAQAVDLTSTIGMNQEYLLEGTQSELLVGNAYAVSDEAVSVTGYSKNGTTDTVSYQDNSASNESFIEIPLLWYPGYSAVDSSGERLTLTAGDNNVIRVYLPGRTEGSFTVRYTGKTIYHAAEALSFLTLAGCAICGVIMLRRKHMGER